VENIFSQDWVCECSDPMKAMRFGHEYEISRREKADKIVSILQDFSKQDLRQYTCLDLGCATGIITSFLKNSFHVIFGVEVDEKLARETVRHSAQDSIIVVADGGKTPFPPQSFNVIICAQVYEHAHDPKTLPVEIWRLLKPGGMCFFSGPNRWSPIEEHYWLPFLSWLPRPMANIYLRLARRGKIYDVRPLYYWQLRALFQRFEVHDYTVQLFHQPERFGLSTQNTLLKLVKLFPTWLIRLFILWLPNYNWVLVKKIE
jgi:SAM-dependent methyltransferase